jgi:hypothetical protein
MMLLMDGRQPPVPKEPDSRRDALLGLLVALLLIVLGLILVRELGNSGRLQDCAMSGRTNCAPIDTTTSGYKATCASARSRLPAPMRCSKVAMRL